MITTEPTFPYRTSTSVLYGAAFPELLKQALSQLSPTPKRPFILISTSLQRGHPSAVDRLRAFFGASLIGERVGIKPHSPWDELLEIANSLRDKSPDVVVTLGGGSLTDGAKILSLLLSSQVSPGESFQYTHLETLSIDGPSPPSSVPQNCIPQICVPTTLSAGEYSPFAGAVDPRTSRKRGFRTPAPVAVLLDPELACLTPEWVWLSTGVRAVDHCIETLCSLEPKAKNHTIQEVAKNGLEKLLRGLLTTKDSPKDLHARLEAQLGARASMSAVCELLPLGGSHAIGHQLGAMGVAHGYTSCVLLPAVCEYNESVNGEKQDMALEVIRKVVGEIEKERESDALYHGGVVGEERKLAGTLRWVFDRLGMPGSLPEVGVEGEEKIQELAVKSLSDVWAMANPRPLEKKEQVLEILRKVQRSRQ